MINKSQIENIIKNIENLNIIKRNIKKNKKNNKKKMKIKKGESL